MCVRAVTVITQVESNVNSFQYITISITIINCGIFTEWNRIQQTTQIKKSSLYLQAIFQKQCSPKKKQVQIEE